MNFRPTDKRRPPRHISIEGRRRPSRSGILPHCDPPCGNLLAGRVFRKQRYSAPKLPDQPRSSEGRRRYSVSAVSVRPCASERPSSVAAPRLQHPRQLTVSCAVVEGATDVGSLKTERHAVRSGHCMPVKESGIDGERLCNVGRSGLRTDVTRRKGPRTILRQPFGSSRRRRPCRAVPAVRARCPLRRFVPNRIARNSGRRLKRPVCRRV